MTGLIVFLVVAFALIAVAYRIMCAISPFTSKGRRRAFYWGRGWWRGDNAQNRGDWR